MFNRLTILLVLFLNLVACGETDKGALLTGNTGNQGEIVVVAPAVIWDSDLGDVLRQSLAEIMPGLPAPEPMFQPVEVFSTGFRDIFKTHRNVLHIDVDPQQETSVKIKRDVYAREQLYVVISLQQKEDIKAVIEEHMEQLLWHFHKAELDRLISRNRKFGSKKLNEQIKEKTGLEITMQQDFEIASEAEDFIWLRLDRSQPIGGYQHQISQGIMIYSRPYTDTLAFSDTNIIAWKNEVNKTRIEGPQGSHMSISYKLYRPEIRHIEFLGETAKEIRGLWRMEGYYMGGPFYSLVFYNPVNGRQYMAEGYVYGPQFNKRAFIREIEAIVKSITLAEKS